MGQDGAHADHHACLSCHELFLQRQLHHPGCAAAGVPAGRLHLPGESRGGWAGGRGRNQTGNSRKPAGEEGIEGEEEGGENTAGEGGGGGYFLSTLFIATRPKPPLVCFRTQEVLAKGGAEPVDWGRLLEPFAFFDSYKNFLRVEVTAASDGDLKKWDGFVHSRLKASEGAPLLRRCYAVISLGQRGSSGANK